MENCKESLDSIAKVQRDPFILDLVTPTRLFDLKENLYFQNDTDIEVIPVEWDHILSKRSLDEAVNVTEADANVTLIAEWHKVHLKKDVVLFNVRTCFNVSELVTHFEFRTHFAVHNSRNFRIRDPKVHQHRRSPSSDYHPDHHIFPARST